MKKKILCMILFLIVVTASILFFSKRQMPVEERAKQAEKPVNTQMKIVTSLEDEILDNTAWCGTFNLIWNDLKNDLAKQDIIFSSQPEAVKNLNKGTFNTSYLSENSYYKIYGKPSLALKAEIESAIQEKFNETSDILDDFDWNNAGDKDYFLYAMLKKQFEFPNVFSELENGRFGNYENVQYFGIDESSDQQLKDQVEVLYYTSKDDFAIKLMTQSNDEVVLAKGCEQNTFGKMYENILQRTQNYEGNSSFSEEDCLKIPTIKFDLKEEIKDVENQPFYFADGSEYMIDKALQTIQFELDKKGGKIKSEAGMMIKATSLLTPDEPRQCFLDDTFTIFLVEQSQDLPYFAAKISDITQVQKEAKEVANVPKTEEMSFFGTVIESTNDSIIVEPKEGQEIRKSADKIAINLEENIDYRYAVRN